LAIITYNQQQAIRPISANRSADYLQIAEETQENDLKRLLGVELYQDIVNNPTEAIYVTLLEGGTFEYNDFTYTQKGLRYVLAYLIYAEYINETRIFDTFSGLVKKNIPESDQAEHGEIKSKQLKYRQLALGAFEEIRLFLNQNTDTYTLWDSANEKKVFNPKITKI